MTIIICHNKPPNRKWDWTAIGVNWMGGWCRTQMRWTGEFEDFEKTGSWGSTVEARGWVFSDLIKVDPFGSRPAEMSWDLRHHKMCRACEDVSIVWLAMAFMICVSLLVSPRNEGRKKEIRSYRLCLYYNCCYWYHYDYTIFAYYYCSHYRRFMPD